MKLLSTVIVLALALAGLGVACGPEETYCYDQHTTCEQARLDKIKRAEEIKAEEEARKDAQMGISDAGATTFD